MSDEEIRETHREDALEAVAEQTNKLFETFWEGHGKNRYDSPFLTDTTSQASQAFHRWVDAVQASPKVCKHIGAEPEMVFGLLAVPGGIYCARCFNEAMVLHTALNPDTCDACGKDHTEFIETVTKASPYLVIAGHICIDCGEEVGQ